MCRCGQSLWWARAGEWLRVWQLSFLHDSRRFTRGWLRAAGIPVCECCFNQVTKTAKRPEYIFSAQGKVKWDKHSNRQRQTGEG